ncbi:MAG: cytochrome P460 family protein [Spirochaetia bacterium]
MKKIPAILSAVLIMIAFSGCGNEETLLPPDYLSWERTTETELDYPIPGHENHYRRIFINQTGTEVRISGEGSEISYQYPSGTVIIKEVYDAPQYTPQSKPVMLTAMVKDPDHPEARSGWVWVVKNLEEDSEQIITEEFCVTCHAAANTPHPYGDGNKEGHFLDFVFFPYTEPEDE